MPRDQDVAPADTTPHDSARSVPARANAFAKLSLGCAAIVSGFVAGSIASAWSRIDTREKVLGFFALVVCAMSIDSLIKAARGLRVVPPGPFRFRLIASSLLTLLAAVFVGVQIAASGLALDVRLVFDALFLSIGLVMLGQTLLAA